MIGLSAGCRWLAAGAASSLALQLRRRRPTRQTGRGDRGTIVRSRATSGSSPARSRATWPSRAGEPFDPQKLDESLKNLFATGLFDDVTIDRAGRSAGRGQVVENPIINRIAFEGNKRLDDQGSRGARSSCARAWSIPARACRTPSAASSSSIAATAAIAAKVEPKIIELDQNRVDLVFEINEGPTDRRRRDQRSSATSTSATARCAGSSRPARAPGIASSSSDDTYDPDRAGVRRGAAAPVLLCARLRRLPGASRRWPS